MTAIRPVSEWHCMQDLEPFGLAPLDMLDADAQATMSISGALVALVTARDGVIAKALAVRMVSETMKADGMDFARMVGMIADYTIGSELRNTEEPVRVIEIVSRAAEYRVVEQAEAQEA